MKEKCMAIKILNALKINSIKILLALSREGQLKWKEIQENTKLPTATLNRSLSSLQNTNLISKESGEYKLTWVGDLILNRLLLFGLDMNGFPGDKKLKEICSEDSLAQNIILELLITVLATLKLQGEVDIEKLERVLKGKMSIIYAVLEGYEREGYLQVKGGKAYTTKKFDSMNLEQIFSM